MAKGKNDHRWMVVAIGIVVGSGCSAGAIKPTDAGQPVDAGVDRGTSQGPDSGTDMAPENRIRSANTVADGSPGRCYLVGGCWSSKSRVARLKMLASRRC